MRRPCCLIVFLLCLLTVTLGGPRYSSRIVHIKTGAIRGIILDLNSRHLEPVEVFRGVPYAAPPIEDLRYRPPNPPLNWTGTKLADTFSPVCPQMYPDISNKTVALQYMPKSRYQYLRHLIPLLANQSEDCLYLNMYVPASGNRGMEAPYAVMVYVHGESFEWNSGNPYDGSVLASYGHVIFISLNYRLGILGFLQTENGEDGNLGLLDIIAALEWVKNNVAAFGGDPSRVTVLGHDTGAALVNLMLLTAAAKGLFHRAVLLSGSILSPWAAVYNPESTRNMVAQQTDCKDSSTTENFGECLRSKSVSSLYNVYIEAPRFLPRFGPVLLADPAHAMEHDHEEFIRCELLLGVTSTESYLDFNSEDIQYGLEEEQRDRVLRTYVRNTYYYHLNEIFSTILNEYTDWEKPVPHPINIRDATMEALSDGHTVSPLLRVAYLHARRGATTYFLHMGYQPKDSDHPQRLGSVRGEDLTYILGQPLVGGEPYFSHNFTRQDVGVAEILLQFFTNFAKTGDPNRSTIRKMYETTVEKPRNRELYWETYETGSQFYLSMVQKPRLRSHYRGHKIAVWSNLIPQLHQPGDDDVGMSHHHFHEKGDHYYSGKVRVESLTRLPLFVKPTNPSDVRATECVPNTTWDDSSDLEDEDDDKDGRLERLTTNQHANYTVALGVTIGIGCLLLLVNIIILAAIYYHRRRCRKSADIPLSLHNKRKCPTVRFKNCSQKTSSTQTHREKIQIATISPVRTPDIDIPIETPVKRRVKISEISV